jgi:hypothetical protein
LRKPGGIMMKHMATSMEWNRDTKSTGTKPFTRSRICSLPDEEKVEQVQQCHHPQEGGGGSSPTLETQKCIHLRDSILTFNRNERAR